MQINKLLKKTKLLLRSAKAEKYMRMGLASRMQRKQERDNSINGGTLF